MAFCIPWGESGIFSYVFRWVSASSMEIVLGNVMGERALYQRFMGFVSSFGVGV